MNDPRNLLKSKVRKMYDRLAKASAGTPMSYDITIEAWNYSHNDDEEEVEIHISVLKNSSGCKGFYARNFATLAHLVAAAEQDILERGGKASG